MLLVYTLVISNKKISLFFFGRRSGLLRRSSLKHGFKIGKRLSYSIIVVTHFSEKAD